MGGVMSASVSRPEETALYLAGRCAKLEAEVLELRNRYDEAGAEAGWAAAKMQQMNDLLRWRDAYGEPPTEEGIYLVINNDFDGGTSIHATYWKGKWPIEFTVANWRPIGPLPGGE
jgi:hypothetical protein